MRLTLAVALTSGLLMFSGCGVAATQFHPGIAAEVGDGSVSNSDVDDSTTAYCRYLIAEGQVLDQPLPLRQLRTAIASQLALVEAARQVASEDHLTTGTLYQQALAAAGTDLADDHLGTDDAQRVLDLNVSNSYVGDIINALGAQILRAKGTQLPTDAQKQAALTATVGTTALAKWITDHKVQIDPRYDVQLVAGVAKPTVEDVSFAESAIAKATAGSAKLSSAQVEALPASQRCG